MSTTLKALEHTLEQLLEPARFKDYCPNGLQVEGRPDIRRVATGVTACQALIDEAAQWGADALLVHHGFFWKGESPVLVGMKRRRVASLLAQDISLLAYHLPLDAHPEYGNNACLGRLMGMTTSAALEPGVTDGVGNVGELEESVSAGELVERLRQLTGREPLHIGDAGAIVRRVAWCTGAAQGYIEAAVAAGADLFVTGEASEQTVHVAREEGIHFVAAGHHATERFGVQAVGNYLADTLGLEHRFFDVDNPV